ncbi:MAG TPA: hypothetical protein VHC45_13980 [Gaiellaceae bacterium]|nr:hypothetical protein [Gaiellaceae bacterium]
MAKVLLLAALAGVLGLARGGADAATAKLPPLPARWPHTLQIGMADSPGGAAALRRSAPFGFRYQYLAGGVNTGSGWSTWNPNGSFVTRYDEESWAAGEIPVFSYYQLLQSKPAGGDEAQTDLAHLRNPQVMSAYWADVRLLLQRAKGAKTVVVHVEPDLWGYVEQAAKGDDASTVPAVVPDGLPQTAAGFAQEWVKLRDALAPNVVLAYHMSGWGTKHDIVYEKPSNATVRAYAARSAAFYRSLHARFDVSFEDFSDRDSGFYEHVEHNPKAWFGPADFARHLVYAQTFVRLAGIRMVAWQIPLGNTIMRAENDTNDHYQDNRVQWLLGSGSRARLKRYAAAGFAGFLFGRGADGNTCACDAAKDGVTNPPPIDGNTRASLSADDDGGYFRAQTRAYYAAGALPLPPS